MVNAYPNTGHMSLFLGEFGWHKLTILRDYLQNTDTKCFNSIRTSSREQLQASRLYGCLLLFDILHCNQMVAIVERDLSNAEEQIEMSGWACGGLVGGSGDGCVG